MLYGRFTHEEYGRRTASGDPFIIHDNRVYRITELVLNQVDARYQLEECDPREMQAWIADHAPVDVEPKAPVVPEPQPPTVAPEEPPAPLKLSLRQYAVRVHGWKGRGPIPNRVKDAYEAYEEEFDADGG